MKSLPRHIAVIMDGNGRWAERKMLPRIAGHHRGVEALRVIVKNCVEYNIQALTLFAFSSENWNRPATEVKLLMSLLNKLLIEEAHQLHTNNVKLRVVGDSARLSNSLQHAIAQAQQLTENNTGLQLNIALNYGGRWDIVQAAKALCVAVQRGELAVDEITENVFHQYVTLNDLPEPDLLIRTSGEQRISNFLLWHLAYTEIYFTPTLWPDFSAEDFAAALKFFEQRQRRFGLVAQQIEQVANV